MRAAHPSRTTPGRRAETPSCLDRLRLSQRPCSRDESPGTDPCRRQDRIARRLGTASPSGRRTTGALQCANSLSPSRSQRWARRTGYVCAEADVRCRTTPRGGVGVAAPPGQIPGGADLRVDCPTTPARTPAYASRPDPRRCRTADRLRFVLSRTSSPHMLALFNNLSGLALRHSKAP